MVIDLFSFWRWSWGLWSLRTMTWQASGLPNTFATVLSSSNLVQRDTLRLVFPQVCECKMKKHFGIYKTCLSLYCNWRQNPGSSRSYTAHETVFTCPISLLVIYFRKLHTFSIHVPFKFSMHVSMFLGSTPLGCYKKLIEYYKSGDLSFKYVKTFNMDEYVGESLSLILKSWTLCNLVKQTVCLTNIN